MYFGVEQYEVLNVNHIKGVHPENRVIGFVLLAIRPPELGKTTNTTFTTSNWRKRSIPTHSEWLYPLTFDAGNGLKEA